LGAIPFSPHANICRKNAGPHRIVQDRIMEALPHSRVHAYVMSVEAEPAAPARHCAVEGINAY
jgi:hypothetical protein